MEVMLNNYCQDKEKEFECLGDSGANVHIANRELQNKLVANGYEFIPKKKIKEIYKQSERKIN